MLRFIPALTLLIFTQYGYAETIGIEQCGFQLELLGKTNSQEQTITLSPDNTAHIFNHSAVQELESSRLITAVMCISISGEADEEKSAFVPEKSLQQMIARIEESGIEVTSSTLLDADENESHQRGFEISAQQAEQTLYAKGLMVQEPGEMLSYSVLVLGHNRYRFKIISELKRTLSSITPLTVSN